VGDQPFELHVLPGPLGAAEIIGVTPARAGDADVAAAVRDALWTHAVLCLRQPVAIDDDELQAVARMIGPIKEPIGRTRDGGTLRYSETRQIVDAGFVLTDELREQLGDLEFGGDALRPGLFETFHTDDTYTEQPALATVLNARELPSSPGGATRFLDMRAAYRSLPAATRSRLAGLRVRYAYDNEDAFPPRVSAKGPFSALVEVTHPLVRRHSATGAPSLYLDLDRALGIVGLDDAEGRPLLQSLQDHAERDAPDYAHAWHANDVVIWDNSAVQHKASGDFPVGEPRRFWRYMVEGPVPAAAELGV
jgi:alpha-ketoglutarate-dependent taurine dioxygenase